MNLHDDLIQRVEATGDDSAGNFNFAADLVRICANYLDVAYGEEYAAKYMDNASVWLRRRALAADGPLYPILSMPKHENGAGI